MMELNLEQMALVNGGTSGETQDDFLRFHNLGKRDLYKGVGRGRKGGLSH